MKYQLLLFCLLSCNALLAMHPPQLILHLNPLSIALSNAIENEDLATIEALLQANADPNQRLPIHTSLGNIQTDELPLTRAVSKGNIEIIRLLLKKGADPSLRNAGGETALDMARRSAQNLVDIRHMFDPDNNTPSTTELKNQEIIQLLEAENKLSTLRKLL